MKAITILCTALLFTLVMQCDPEEDNLAPPIDLDVLNDDTVRIFGDFNGQPFVWVYGEGYGLNRGHCIYIENSDVFASAGMSKSNGTVNDNRFRLKTPMFNLLSEVEVADVFEPGTKFFGPELDGFKLTMTIDGVAYESCDLPSNYELEVLQRGPMTTYGLDEELFTVWFRLNQLDLGECSNLGQTALLENVVMVLQFAFPIQ